MATIDTIRSAADTPVTPPTPCATASPGMSSPRAIPAGMPPAKPSI